MTDASSLRRSARGRRDQAGLTLVELMITVAVFTVGLVALLTSMASVVNHHKISVIKQNAYDEMLQVLVDLDGDFGSGADVFDFDINDPTPIELDGLPGSTVTLSIVNDGSTPGSVGDNQDPSDDIVVELPCTVAEYFGGTPPADPNDQVPQDPVEIVIVALVPVTPGSNQFYRFQLSRLFDL